MRTSARRVETPAVTRPIRTSADSAAAMKVLFASETIPVVMVVVGELDAVVYGAAGSN